MIDEVSVIGRVDVDIDGLAKLGAHAALVPAEPVVAVYLSRTGPQRERVATVHAFTADGAPLVLGKRGLESAFSAAGPQETFDHLRPRSSGRGPAVGPFTPAPPGLVAEFDDSSQPILFFDRHGRPVLVDDDSLGRTLYLAEEDEALLRIAGKLEAWPSHGASSTGDPR